MNFDTMQTMFYNRRKLASRLGLDESHLPLMATLVGNDVVQVSDLRRFHRKVVGWTKTSRIDRNILFPQIARYVKQCPPGVDVLQYLPSISKNVFGSDMGVPKLASSLRIYFGMCEEGIYNYF